VTISAIVICSKPFVIGFFRRRWSRRSRKEKLMSGKTGPLVGLKHVIGVTPLRCHVVVRLYQYVPRAVRSGCHVGVTRAVRLAAGRWTCQPAHLAGARGRDARFKPGMHIAIAIHCTASHYSIVPGGFPRRMAV